MTVTEAPALTITFAGRGDAFGSGGRYQACIHLRSGGCDPVLLDCGATSLSALNVAAGADLLIAEAYYRDKKIPYHLSHADLVAHRDQLTARRIIVTHMSADMLQHQASFESAHDGLVLTL